MSGRAVCYSMSETGSCKFGDQCRFSHGENDTRPAPERRAPRRNYGGSSEVCYSFQNTGACKFGDNCRFTHGDATGAAAAGGASSAPRERRAPKVKSDECFTWRDSGACEYGEKCRYRHGTADTRDLEVVKKRANGTCYEWKERGDCKWGARCRFAHENLPEEATASAAEPAAAS